MHIQHKGNRERVPAYVCICAVIINGTAFSLQKWTSEIEIDDVNRVDKNIRLLTIIIYFIFFRLETNEQNKKNNVPRNTWIVSEWSVPQQFHHFIQNENQIKFWSEKWNEVLARSRLEKRKKKFRKLSKDFHLGRTRRLKIKISVFWWNISRANCRHNKSPIQPNRKENENHKEIIINKLSKHFFRKM